MRDHTRMRPLTYMYITMFTYRTVFSVLFLLMFFSLPYVVAASVCNCFRNGPTLAIHCDKYVHDETRNCFSQNIDATRLQFTHSNLKEIPRELVLLEALERIDLSNNAIVEVEFSPFQKLQQSLQEINLDSNSVRVLRNYSILNMQRLSHFSIQNNSLEEIEPAFFRGNLTGLVNMQFSFNKLIVIDASAISLPSLWNQKEIIVNVSYNNIDIVSNIWGLTIDQLSPNCSFHLFLIHNNMTTIDISYYRKSFNVTNILSLYNLWNSGFDLRFNPFICDCRMYLLSEYLKAFRHMDPNNPFFSITCGSPPSLRGRMIYDVPPNDFNCTVTEHCPPGCSCIETVGLQLLTVTCDNSISDLPDYLPREQNVILRVRSNALDRLKHMSYLPSLQLLDVSHCHLGGIDVNVIDDLDNIQEVYLNENQLTTLPKQVQSLKFVKLKMLALHDNPLHCDCHSLWLKKWLTFRQNFILNIERVTCATGPGSGQSITSVPDKDFICPRAKLTTGQVLLIILLSVVTLVTVILCITYKHRRYIHVILIHRFDWLCLRQKIKSSVPYDIFVSHSRHDSKVVTELTDLLENKSPKYKTCVCYRDFKLGEPVIENVVTYINQCHTVLIVLSNNFLKSEWCKYEYRLAHEKVFKERRVTVVFVRLEELDANLVKENELLYETLKLKHYIDKSDKLFEAKLKRQLPVRKMMATERQPLLAN